jgi:protein-tyrosine-phosphatase
MNSNLTIVFVCEHGAAKSIVAAAYFNQIAAKSGLDLQAKARGTNPDAELSPQTVKGLSEDGLIPPESIPQKLTDADLQSAQRVVTFCDLPAEYRSQAAIEYWDGIPPVSENYAQSRDMIVERIHHLLNQ